MTFCNDPAKARTTEVTELPVAPELRIEINFGPCISFKIPDGLNSMDELVQAASVIEQLVSKMEEITAPEHILAHVADKLSNEASGMRQKYHAYRGMIGDWNKEEAKEFLVKAGFITEDGKLHPNYE